MFGVVGVVLVERGLRVAGGCCCVFMFCAHSFFQESLAKEYLEQVVAGEQVALAGAVEPTNMVGVAERMHQLMAAEVLAEGEQDPEPMSSVFKKLLLWKVQAYLADVMETQYESQETNPINLFMSQEDGKTMIKRDGQGNPKIPFVGRVCLKPKAQSTNR